MKKILNFVGVLLLFFTLPVTVIANTVTIKFDSIYSSGILVGAMQMGFDDHDQYGFPFLSDAGDPFAESDLTYRHNFGDEGIWNNSVMESNWYLESLEEKNSNTGITSARGYVIYCGEVNDAYALHDGRIAELSSNNTNFRIDLSSIQVFDFVDTATPISELVVTESFSGDNHQIVTISSVPIPGAVWLLGSGLIGLAGIRRRYAK